MRRAHRSGAVNHRSDCDCCACACAGPSLHRYAPPARSTRPVHSQPAHSQPLHPRPLHPGRHCAAAVSHPDADHHAADPNPTETGAAGAPTAPDAYRRSVGDAPARCWRHRATGGPRTCARGVRPRLHDRLHDRVTDLPFGRCRCEPRHRRQRRHQHRRCHHRHRSNRARMRPRHRADPRHRIPLGACGADHLSNHADASSLPAVGCPLRRRQCSRPRQQQRVRRTTTKTPTKRSRPMSVRYQWLRCRQTMWRECAHRQRATCRWVDPFR